MTYPVIVSLIQVQREILSSGSPNSTGPDDVHDRMSSVQLVSLNNPSYEHSALLLDVGTGMG